MLPIIVFGGLYVRNVVLTTLAGLDHVRDARVDVNLVLTAQLDEETGMRGFAAGRDPGLLEPYHLGRDRFDGDVAALRGDLIKLGIPAGERDLDALAAINADWLRTIAEPTLGNVDLFASRERPAKQMVDAYRAHVDRIIGAINERRRGISDEALLAVERITIFSSLATLAVLIAALLLGLQQRAMQRRIDEEQQAAREARAEYAAEKRISDTLQEAFMLKPLGNVATVRLSGIYVPATEETLVGGDWYDGIELENGRVLIAIGDVAGHGLEAAVAMNRTRQAMLASALAGSDPASVLMRVNEELLIDNGRMVTAVYGYADAKLCAFTFAAAGHPPPIIIEPGGEPQMLLCGGVPLAVMHDAQYHSQTIQTVPGAMLVLYTDGAIEHSRDIFAGEAILKDAIADAFRSAVENPADHIRDAIFHARAIGDDVAIVTLTFHGDALFSASGPDASLGAVVSKSGPTSRSV
jgi:serine phosphatase RsbU (regulator of sigma subunit)